MSQEVVTIAMSGTTYQAYSATPLSFPSTLCKPLQRVLNASPLMASTTSPNGSIRRLRGASV